MSTEKQQPQDERADSKTSGQQQPTAADFDKLMQEAEQDSPRTKEPGSSSGHNSEQNNNGRGGGK